MIYEVRTYDCKPQSVPEVEKRFAEAYETRKRFSPLAAYWHTEIGPLNQVIHVWPYKDLEERRKIREAAVKEGAGKWPPNTSEFMVAQRSDIFQQFEFSPELKPGKQGPFFEMRIYTYAPELGVSEFNLLSTIGAFVIGLATLIFFYNLVRTRWRPIDAPNDPWGGATLEWAMSSPPPVYNFTVIPTVSNRLPLWQTERHGPMTPLPDRPPAPIHVPGGSWWPMITAAGLPLMAIGALSRFLPIVFVGVAVVIVGIYRWAYEPFEM